MTALVSAAAGSALVFSDFRAHSRDQKRARDRKHKWALGPRPTSPELERPRKARPKEHMSTSERLKFRSHISPREELLDPVFQDPTRRFLHDLQPVLGAAAGPSSADDCPVLLPACAGCCARQTPASSSSSLSSSSSSFSAAAAAAAMPSPVLLPSLTADPGWEIELLIKNEFVILDDRGQPTHGRRKLGVLRQSEKASLELDGYELV